MNLLTGRIIEAYNEGNNRLGLVEFDGRRRAIYLSLVPDAQVGDDVLFHAGFATERVKPNEAEAVRKQPGSEGQPHKPDLEIDGAYRLLSALDPQQLRKLIPLAQDHQFAGGRIIFPAGAKSVFLHLIVSGDVALEATSGNQTVPVQTLYAGDAMGWSSFIGEGLTHFQARALSPVSTIAFQGDQLRAACDSDPALGYALMKRLMELATERLDAMRLKLAERSNG
jgi:CRP/FNR family cyclic AMP-dependent transcriptional regulator